MKYVVVGGAGFSGSHIVDKLVEQNHEVIIIDNLSTGHKKLIPKKVKLGAVTKKKLISDIQLLYNYGHKVFGEN